MLRPNILKDENMSSRVQRIIVEVLRKHFQQRVKGNWTMGAALAIANHDFGWANNSRERINV